MAANSLRAPVAGDRIQLSQPPELPELGRWWFTRHWFGELSLGYSWWACGTLAKLPYATISALTNGINFDEMSPRFALLLIILVILYFALGLWWMVGVWRSASRRVKEERAKKQWPVLPRTAQVLTLINVVLLTQSLLQFIEEFR